MAAYNPIKTLEGLSILKIETPLGRAAAAAWRGRVAGLWFLGQKRFPAGILGAPEAPRDPALKALKEWLERYFRKEDPGPPPETALFGTPCQLAVWREASRVPYGATSSYKRIAEGLPLEGRAAAPRAAASALARNPVSIVVPCHRILDSAGDLCGYAGGLFRKRALLALEGARFRERGGTGAGA
jgi:methylated-DNA-[protein]-cysteine S-methyltransferase